MSRQVALAPKIAALETSGAEWSKLATTLEAAVRELQVQVRGRAPPELGGFAAYAPDADTPHASTRPYSSLQVKELQAKNTTLETEVESLKKGGPRDGVDGRDGADGMLRSESMVKASAPGSDAGSMRRMGATDMLAMAELTGM